MMAPTVRTARRLRPIAWLHALAAAGIAVAALGASPGASAALFEDDEARRAILDLRQRVDANRVATERQAEDARAEVQQLRRSMLELQTQIEMLRGELARMVGQNEQLLREVADLQRKQKDVQQGIDERLRKVEPAKVNVDGREFIAEPNESRDFENALAVFRKGDFPAAQTAFADFIKRYPQSGFRPTALFWLGNAQYANRDYRGAIANFRALLVAAPDHPRAAESVLSIANCQIELKDTAGARKSLTELVKDYPQSEAAQAAKERLARLR
ncbi:tol-pal system protein YbgF [Caenimonas koreensis]|uniref:Cell division coordinator CpoB n=1 Tax=Caenimonas koreensis DSM 17982 TaxID=1121255 RepID=A0A844BA67_9BURK|nr:tol-pal system protein YbgF [Caenimonas koreensis]MRD48489.1 tol-pal system protein YbgF [Caenimonas koreensis DSM 17982]